jgi:RND family efflux transporter MFP subunit
MTNVEKPRYASLSDLRISDEQRKDGGRGRRKWWIVAAVCAALVIIAAAVASFGRPAEVQVAQVRPGSAADRAILNASGYVTPRRRATVAAKVTGRVEVMLVEEGIRVEAGQVLARLDDSDARAQFAAAVADRNVAEAAVPDLKASLDQAKQDLERYRSLVAKGFVTAQDVDHQETLVANYEARLQQARESVHAAVARIGEARQNMENCIVRAPFSGVAVSKDAQVGEMVSPISAGGGYTRTGIATIVDMKSLEIEVDVNEAFIARIRPGQKAVATLDAYPDWEIPCAVRTIIPTADRQKATVKVRLSFEKLDPRILPDMGIKVAFLEEGDDVARKAAAVMPADAVRGTESAPFCFVYSEGRLEKRPLRLGEKLGSNFEVISGPKAGESVVVEGPRDLKNGERARVKS